MFLILPSNKPPQFFSNINSSMTQRTLLIFFPFRRGVGALPSSRLMKSRGSVAPGDDSSLPDESTVDGTGDESEK